MQAHLIKVTPAKNSNGGIDWTLCTKGNVCGGSGSYPAVDLAKDSGAQVIVVSINDPANLGISFPQTAEEAIWIQPDTKPTGPVVAPADQIQVASTSKTLVITDLNKDPPMILKYQLNFVGPDNAKVTSIDPDIKNGGGRAALYGVAEVVAAFVIGAAVFLTLTVLWFRRMRPRNPA